MWDSARDESGGWRVNRRLLILAGFIIMATVVSIWPIGVIPWYTNLDIILHASGGAAIALILAGIIPTRDDILICITALLGVVWEPIEWYWFDCIQTDACTEVSLIKWMVGEDTLFDITLVALGAIVALIVIGRYR